MTQLVLTASANNLAGYNNYTYSHVPHIGAGSYYGVGAMRFTGASALIRAWVNSANISGTASRYPETDAPLYWHVDYESSFPPSDYSGADSGGFRTRTLYGAAVTITGTSLASAANYSVSGVVTSVAMNPSFSGVFALQLADPSSAGSKEYSWAGDMTLTVDYDPMVSGSSTVTSTATGVLMAAGSNAVTTTARGITTQIGSGTAATSYTAILRVDIVHGGRGEAIRCVVVPPLKPAFCVPGEPTYAANVFGGPTLATLGSEVADTDDLLLSDVRCFDEDGLAWHGYVWDSPARGKITAVGSSSPLSLPLRPVDYVNTQTDFYHDYTLRCYNFEVASDSDKLQFNLTKDVNAASDVAYISARKDIASTSGAYVSFDYSRPTNGMGVSVYLLDSAGTQLATADSGWGSGGTTGSVSVSDSGTVAAVRLYAYLATGTASGAITVSNLKIMGADRFDGSAIYPSTVISHLCDKLPEWSLPAGAQYRSHIAASTYDFDSLAFGSDSTDTEKVAEVCRYETMEYRWEPRFYGARQYSVPCYTAPSACASIAVDLSECESDFTESDVESLASVVRVNYYDEGGRGRFRDVTDTDATHYLVRVGRTVYTSISADTQASGDALQLGTVALAEYGALTRRGTVTTRRVRHVNGARLPLSAVRPGQRIVLMGTGDERVARVTEVSREGQSVRITLDDAPYRLSTALARSTR